MTCVKCFVWMGGAGHEPYWDDEGEVYGVAWLLRHRLRGVFDASEGPPAVVCAAYPHPTRHGAVHRGTLITTAHPISPGYRQRSDAARLNLAGS